MNLEALLDKQAIYEQLATYCRAVDRIDLALLRSVFTADAVLDYGEMFRGTAAEFAEFIGEVHPAMDVHAHHLGSVLVTLDGDEAGSEAYVTARLRSANPKGTVDLVSHGRYVDRWERRDACWRIQHRQYLHTFDDAVPVASAAYPAGGSRDAADPSYAVLRPHTRNELSRTRGTQR